WIKKSDSENFQLPAFHCALINEKKIFDQLVHEGNRLQSSGGLGKLVSEEADQDGRTALHYAVANRFTHEIVEEIVCANLGSKTPAEIPEFLYLEKDDWGMNALMVSCMIGTEANLRCMLEYLVGARKPPVPVGAAPVGADQQKQEAVSPAPSSPSKGELSSKDHEGDVEMTAAEEMKVESVEPANSVAKSSFPTLAAPASSGQVRRSGLPSTKLLEKAVNFKQDIPKQKLRLAKRAGKLEHWGRTAAHWACAYNQAKCLLVLVESGVCDVNIKDREHMTPLALAVRNNAKECVQILLKANKGLPSFGHGPPLVVNKKFQLKLNVGDKQKKTALHYAAKNGRLEILKMLIEDSNELVPVVGFTTASTPKQVGMEDDLVADQGISPAAAASNGSSSSLTNSKGELILAAKKKLDADAGNGVGEVASPGPASALRRQGEAHQQQTANKNASRAFLDSLSAVPGKGLKYKAPKQNPLHLADSSGNNILHYACGYGYLDIVEYLIALDPSLASAQNAWKCSPLMVAWLKGQFAVLKYMVEQLVHEIRLSVNELVSRQSQKLTSSPCSGSRQQKMMDASTTSSPRPAGHGLAVGPGVEKFSVIPKIEELQLLSATGTEHETTFGWDFHK
ncbi:unnamed protein product, partial [Amoebophrya sp. A25]